MFHNHLIEETQLPDTAVRVAFNTLREGESYQYVPGGQVYTVTRRDFTFATVRRHDDWLLHMDEGCWIWDRMVIRVAPVGK